MLVLIIIFLIPTVVIFYYNSIYFKLKHQRAGEQKEFERLKLYTAELELLSNGIRGFKHDCSNILLTLGNFIDEGDIQGLKEYFYKELVPECKAIVKVNNNLGNLQHVKLIPIKSLISSKYFSAGKLGIVFNIEVIEDINKIDMKIIDLSRIVGILLDNAIEEAKESKEKYISLGFYRENDETTLVVNNSCRNNTKVDNIYNKGFSTKGESRGIGLKNLRTIIDEKYSNALLRTRVDKNVFTQELIVYERQQVC